MIFPVPPLPSFKVALSPRQNQLAVPDSSPVVSVFEARTETGSAHAELHRDDWGRVSSCTRSNLVPKACDSREGT
jgi:hypothetical protein